MASTTDSHTVQPHDIKPNTPLTWHGVMRYLTAMTISQLMVLQSAYTLEQYAIKKNVNRHARRMNPSRQRKNFHHNCPYQIAYDVLCFSRAYAELTLQPGERVINSNWDISAELEHHCVNTTLEQCFWWSPSPICCTQEHICAQCPRRNPLAENISILQGDERERVRHCEHYYASRQQISILIAPQLY